MYRRCCRLLTMVAVNAAPAAAAAVLLTDGANNSTAAHHFLVTPPPPATDTSNMSFAERYTKDTTININNGLLLYYHQSSFYSQKVVMALYEKNLPFESHLIDIVKGVQYEPWFLQINPSGEVPVLLDTGKIIPDSSRIIDYLEDNFSNGDTPRLIPMDQGPEIRQKVTHFRNIIDTIPANLITLGSFIHSDLAANPKAPFFSLVRKAFVSKERNSSEELRKYAELNPEAREVLLEKATAKEVNFQRVANREEFIKMLEQVDGVLNAVEHELSKHGPDRANWWLCSDRFTAADIALTILLERLNQLGFESRFWAKGKRPNIEKYYARVQHRDSYKRTIPSLLLNMKILLSSQSPVFIGVGIAAALAVFISGICLVRKIMA